MSNQQTQDYNEYMYELEKANDEKENRIAGEEARHEGEGEEPEDGFDNEESKLIPGNPMIDREPQEELDRVTNRESYSFFENNCETE